MPYTADQISTRALRSLNVIGVGQTPTAAQLSICYEALQDMVDSWGLDRLLKAAVLRSVLTLVSGTASYTIGTGGVFNIARPLSIEAARLIPDSAASPTREVPIQVFSDQDWENVEQKSLAGGTVNGIYYDRVLTGAATGLSTLYVYPVPNVSTLRLVLYTPTAQPVFADQNATSYTFLPGVSEALHLNLQCRVHASFAAPLSPSTERLASRLLNKIMLANATPRRLALPAALPGMGGHRGDIRRGY